MIYSKGAATVTVLSTNPHIYFEYFGPYAVPIDYNRRSFFRNRIWMKGVGIILNPREYGILLFWFFNDPHSFQVKHVTQTIIRKWVIAGR